MSVMLHLRCYQIEISWYIYAAVNWISIGLSNAYSPVWCHLRQYWPLVRCTYWENFTCIILNWTMSCFLSMKIALDTSSTKFGHFVHGTICLPWEVCIVSFSVIVKIFGRLRLGWSGTYIPGLLLLWCTNILSDCFNFAWLPPVNCTVHPKSFSCC